MSKVPAADPESTIQPNKEGGYANTNKHENNIRNKRTRPR
jgi:hypothetical protein